MRVALNPFVGVSFLLITVLALIARGPQESEASTLVVNTTADSGAGSFRQALIDAGNNPGLDVITFDPSVFPEGAPATIMATEPYKVEGAAASQPLTIDGFGAGVIISGEQAPSDEGLLEFLAVGALSGITLRNFTLQQSIAASFDGGEGIETGPQVTDVTDVLIEEVAVLNNEGIGIALAASGTMSNVTVRDSDINENGSHGLFLEAEMMDGIEVVNNHLLNNDATGIEIKAGSSPVPATIEVRGNEIRQNDSHAILIAATTGNGPHVTISENTTTGNGGLGINLKGGSENGFDVTANDVGDGDDGPNKLLNFPVLNGVGPTGIVGTACANCTVELFIADSDPSGHGEGGGYFATGTADGDGDFEISGCGQNGGANVTATATDVDGNTSEFALNYILPSTPPCGTPTPSPTPSPTAPTGEVVVWGDDNCSGDADPIDSLLTLRFDAGLSTNTGECPGMGEVVEVTNASPHPWGDVDCGGDVNPVDSLKLLRFDAGLDVAQAAGCPEMGSEVQVLAQQ